MREKRRVVRTNIISWDSGGLGTDIDVLTAVLEKLGCEVAFKGRRHRLPRNRVHSLLMTAGVIVNQAWAALARRPQFDVNFFIESIFPEYLPTARVNGLFVNPEWFRDENLAHVGRLDVLLCKTPSGVTAVRDLGVPARDVGFTSPDKRIVGHVRQGPVRCLHLSGQSAVKGTEAVVEAWSRHPEWPHLTVVRRTKRYGGAEAPSLPALPNASYETDYVSAERLRQLQNDCEVHVLPSQAEGYGHVIGEAMSCAAVVVTTDAPPMNELIAPDRGVLIRVARTEKQYKSSLSFVDVSDLEEKLARVFELPAERRAELGRNARSWYDAQHLRFGAALRSFIEGLPARSTRMTQ